MKKTICVFLTVLLVFSLIPDLMARNEGCFRGEKDAENAENMMKFVYFGAGCLLGPIGLLIGYMVMPPIPEAALLGKSSAYVADYTSCYNETAIKIQGTASLIGCGVFLVEVWAVYMLAAVILPFMDTY